MTTERKHDGYLLFCPKGVPVTGTNHMTDNGCKILADEFTNCGWHNLRDQGYTVRRITITEVKDDE